MSNEQPRKQQAYDLDRRTERFGEAVIAFARLIPVNKISRPLIGQVVRAGTCVGATYGEADEALSRKDFRYKIGCCRRESRETRRWLRMIVAAHPPLKDPAAPLVQEATELHLIFCAILRTLDRKP